MGTYTMKIFGITGHKNTGKTNLMERVLKEIVSRGITVSTVKHAHHDTDIDHPGRDSYRHRQAGASQVVLSTKNRWAIMTELRGSPEAKLENIIKSMNPVQLILIEGYKDNLYSKIETFRQEINKPLLARSNGTIKAVASDTSIQDLKVPNFNLNDTKKITNFVLQEVGIKIET